MGRAEGERGLTGTRRPDEEDDAMQRDDASVNLGAEGEIQDSLRQELRL